VTEPAHPHGHPVSHRGGFKMGVSAGGVKEKLPDDMRCQTLPWFLARPSAAFVLTRQKHFRHILEGCPKRSPAMQVEPRSPDRHSVLELSGGGATCW